MINNILLFICLLFLTSCYTDKVFNVNGELSKKTTFLTKPKHLSYSSDKKLVKGVFLNTINDTIDKRCFSYDEIKQLKTILKQKKIYASNIVLRKSFTYNSKNCLGVFFIYINEDVKNKYFMIPILKFQNKLTINSSYIEGRSSKKDSTEVIQDIMEFENSYKSGYKDSTLKSEIKNYKNGIILSKTYFGRQF